MGRLPISANNLSTIFCLIIICAGVSVTSSFDGALWRTNERFQRNNCTKCVANMERNVQEVLPRLSLIKQRILNAIGRNPVSARDFSGDIDTIGPRHAHEVLSPPVAVKSTDRLGYRMKEIVSYPESDLPGDHEGETIFKFHLHGNGRGLREEALGASLLIFVDRRRRTRKGGRGKKILLEISKLNDDNTWESLTYLQTRVKKRRWKRVSLPVKSVQELLESESRKIAIKVRCEGCGRLVNIVINKTSNKELTKRRRSRNYHSKRNNKRVTKETKEKRHKKRLKRKENTSGTPFLIISTRVRV